MKRKTKTKKNGALIDHKMIFLYSVKVEVRRQRVFSSHFSGECVPWATQKSFATLYMSENDHESTTSLIWGLQINFSDQVISQTQNLQLIRIDCTSRYLKKNKVVPGWQEMKLLLFHYIFFLPFYFQLLSSLH